jgi:hypothetical protein
LLLISSKLATAQCPQIYDYLGNLVNRPYFIDCQGTGTYNMNFASNTGWGAYTINWGDGTANTVGGSYTANSLINHTYNSASPDTFVITLNIPSLSCTLTGIAVMEKPVNASIQIPIGGVTTACAPKALLFTNSVPMFLKLLGLPGILEMELLPKLLAIQILGKQFPTRIIPEL